MDPGRRWLATIAIILATFMTTLDQTIANVALPHIQASVSASPDQITWVLTSYIVAAAIMIPLSGWLAGRIGIKRMLLISVGAFALTSMACGAAVTLPQLVIFRLFQGLAGASLVPLSQAVIMDINPPEKQSQAIAMWSSSAMLGPVFGPVVGGYLTEHLNWRWCFYINVPIALLALAGIWIFLAADGPARRKTFDFLGFGMLSLFIGATQLLLDRGPSQDWFSAKEIWIEAALGATGLWVFIFHTLTTARPFFDRAMARNRNFVSGCIFSFFFGFTMTGSTALLPLMLQSLLAYPVFIAGLISAPRGFGTSLAMFLMGWIAAKADPRLMIALGVACASVGFVQMTHFDLSMSGRGPMIAGLVQGFGSGMIVVPLMTLSFAALPISLRAEGSGLITLARNLGGSVGISVMQALLVANTQVMHASIAARIAPNDPVVRALPPALNPSTMAGAEGLNAEITRQAAMVAYVDDFRLLLVLMLAGLPLLLLMRRPAQGQEAHLVVE
jgi:DHA2 family multidrug resistance protein